MKKIIKRSDGVKQTVNLGSDHHNWKGGRTNNGKGYILVNVSQDPMFNGAAQILEHRYVMAKLLGRKLYRTEAVHHKNGNTEDNRIENLEIMSFHDHWFEHHGHRVGKHFTLKERYCNFCQTKFYPATGCNSSKQKCCSLSCAMKLKWRHKDAYTKFVRTGHRTLKERSCPQCKKSFYPSSGHNKSKQRFCSISCGLINRHKS